MPKAGRFGSTGPSADAALGNSVGANGWPLGSSPEEIQFVTGGSRPGQLTALTT